MPGARWFEGAELNYAENLLPDRSTAGRDPARGGGAAHLRAARARARSPGASSPSRSPRPPAACARSGSAAETAWWPTCRTSPRRCRVPRRGSSIGAIWSSAAPEFGARSVIDRFAQIEPKVLLAVDGYRHGGKDFDRIEVVEAILAELPTRRARGRARLPARGTRRPERLGAGDGERPAPRLGGAARRWATGARAAASSRSRSITRCGCSTPPARPGCRRRSCRATAGSCSSS